MGRAWPSAAVAGFPHGSTTTAVKLYEIRDVLRRGAKEVDMVLNIARLLSRQFQYRRDGTAAGRRRVPQAGRTAEGDFRKCLPYRRAEDRRLPHLRARGSGLRQNLDGIRAHAATPSKICKLMRAHTPEHIGVKAAGGVRTLEKALEVYQVGCSRFGATATAAILDEWKARLHETAGRAAS